MSVKPKNPMSPYLVFLGKMKGINSAKVSKMWSELNPAAKKVCMCACGGVCVWVCVGVGVCGCV